MRQVRETINLFETVENAIRLEIAIGFSINIGDEVVFFENPQRDGIVETYLKNYTIRKNVIDWIYFRNHISGGRINRIDYEANFYTCAAISIGSFWFPVTLIEYINNEKVNWLE